MTIREIIQMTNEFPEDKTVPLRLKKEIGKNTEITVATDDGVYHLMPNRIDFNNP